MVETLIGTQAMAAAVRTRKNESDLEVDQWPHGL